MKQIRRIMAMVLVFALFITAGNIATIPVQAETTPALELQKYSMVYQKNETDLVNTRYAYIRNMPKNGKITKVTSKNSKVATAGVALYAKNGVQLTVKKPGNTTFEVTVKAGKKTYKLKASLTVCSYTSPVSSVKIGSKQYASAFKKNNRVSIAYKKNGKYRLSVTPKKDWKLLSSGYYEGFTSKAVSNNGTFTVKKKNGCLLLTFYNSKKNIAESIRVEFKLGNSISYR